MKLKIARFLVLLCASTSVCAVSANYDKKAIATPELINTSSLTSIPNLDEAEIKEDKILTDITPELPTLHVDTKDSEIDAPASVTAEHMPVVNLMDAYRLAMLNDPTYKEAVATYLATREACPQAWAAAFPQVFANGNAEEIEYRLIRKRRRDLNERLDTHNMAVDVSQVLFDWAVFNRIKKSNAIVKKAVYDLAAAKQDLMLRVSRAYFNVLLAKDNLSFTRSQRDNSLVQLRAVRERYKVGHSTIASLEQFQGQYDLFRSQVYGDKIALSDSIQDLSEIIGRRFGKLTPLKKQFPLTDPHPQKLATWLEHAKSMNLSIQAARYELISTREEIKVAQGGHLPTLNATANYARNKNPTTSAVVIATNNSQTAGAGLTLNFPIFQGGAVMSQVREAIARNKVAKAGLDKRYLEAMANAEKSYNAIILGVGQIKAGFVTVNTNISALKHIEEGFRAGMQSTLDVIQQQTRLLVSQRTYARDRYNYLTNTILLQQATGTLRPKNLLVIQKLALAS